MAESAELAVSSALSPDLLLSSVNIAENFDDAMLNRIGSQVVEGFEADKGSREEWERRYEQALKLAAQVVEHKSFPWQGAANIKYPLLTTACIQFSARAYPALIPGQSVVQTKVTGFDPQGEKSSAGDRIGRHMSYQLLEQMEEWEEDMDRMLVMLPCTGTEFKKTYYDPIKGRNVSEHVLARDLVVNYWAKSLESASRKTHVLYLTPNEIRERVLNGVYLDQDLKRSTAVPDALKIVSDKIQGLTPPIADDDTPFEILECHTWFDLDDDDYKEPYVVTVERQTGKVLRITARFDQEGIKYGPKNKILSITPVEYFTKFSFIPSIDGGFYDLGWGHLLGPINETVNTTINQLLDAGTLSNMQAGFLSRGIRLRGGQTPFKPGEWKFVDSTGDDLRKGILPLPVREPSNVLFQLLGTMTGAGERLSNVVDILLGESPGQNQPATTTMAVIEQGLKVFTAVYKRLFRSLTGEFRKLYRLNRIYLRDEEYFRVLDLDQQTWMRIQRSDYQRDFTDVQPAADPNMVSDAQRLVRAQALVASLQAGAPANPLEIWKRYYEALRIDGIERLLPEQMPEPPPDPKMVAIQVDDKHQEMQHQLDQMRMQLDQAKLQLEQDKLAFEQEMERYRAQYEQGDQAKQESEAMGRTLELVKIELERERLQLEREKLQLERDMREREIASTEKVAEKQGENQRQMKQMEITSRETEKTKEVEKEKESEENDKAVTGILEQVRDMIEKIAKPKQIVRDKEGNPIGIKPVEKL